MQTAAKALVSYSERLSIARRVVGITKKDYTAWKRPRWLVIKRAIIYSYLYDVWSMSYREIAYISNRDHKAIQYCVRKYRYLYEEIKDRFDAD